MTCLNNLSLSLSHTHTHTSHDTHFTVFFLLTLYIECSLAVALMGPRSKLAIFGYSVSVSGNVIVVGAPGASNSAGMAFVYRGCTSASSLTCTDKNKVALTQPVAGKNWFGISVSVSGNVLLVGAYNLDDDDDGAAYIYYNGGTKPGTSLLIHIYSLPFLHTSTLAHSHIFFFGNYYLFCSRINWD